jgi:ribosomal protein S18 acetylase RimI-like enzyme
MEIDLKGTVETFPFSENVEHFRAGDAALLATVQNRIFTGTWGFCPNSPEDIRYFFRLTQSKWQDILMIRENEKIIGYSWLHPVIKKERAVEKRKWKLHMFGIDPEFQAKGRGKKLLQTSLGYVRKKDGTSLEITIDSENTPAINLYKSAGFKVKSREYWYAKDLL